MTKWLGVAAAVVLGTGCNYGASAFQCNDDTQCGAGGTCEPGFGLCSFPDPDCTSGRRFGDLAGDRSNQCVDPQPPGIDASTPDVSVDTPPDAQTCFGTSPFTVCLVSAPTIPMTISAAKTINTDDPSMCEPVEAVKSGGDGYCVLAATNITISAKLRATGTKPLVLLASGSITTSAAIDVGSHRGAIPEVGAGADPMVCASGILPGTSGGGAGGSFTGIGGAGGGTTGGTTGGTAGAGVGAVSVLRGGCSGQEGQGSANGIRGHGGGAVYLIAGNSIDVMGGINAAGEGGTAGTTNNSGGGGGGAGGMIGLDAPTITVASLLLANGGAGGEGSGQTTPGNDGEDPVTTAPARGGRTGSGNGGDGGNGSAGPAAGSGSPGLTDTNSGGGGGGGAGLIKAPATASLGNQVSPAATP